MYNRARGKQAGGIHQHAKSVSTRTKPWQMSKSTGGVKPAKNNDTMIDSLLLIIVKHYDNVCINDGGKCSVNLLQDPFK